MRKSLIASLLMVTLVVLCSVGARTAYAAPGPVAGSSPVLVAVDATAQSNCQETLHINIGWHTTPPLGAAPLIASTKIIPCPAGTIAKTAQVSLAQALAQHESYAQMPTNPQAPTAAERAAIHALIDAKHLSLTSEQAAAVQPLTACGATSSASLQWTADSVGFYSTIHWFKYTNCSQVLLDEAHLNIGYFSFGEQWDWGSDVYYNDQWYLNLGALKPYTGQYYYPNRTAATNHWYRQYVDEYVPTYGTTTWESYIAVCN